MDTVDTSLLDTMSSFFFTETWRIAGQSLWQLLLIDHRINKASDHGMLGSTDQIQILAFNLVHHSIHLIKTHNTGNNITSDHVWRNAVCESTVNHKVTGISQNC